MYQVYVITNLLFSSRYMIYPVCIYIHRRESLHPRGAEESDQGFRRGIKGYDNRRELRRSSEGLFPHIHDLTEQVGPEFNRTRSLCQKTQNKSLIVIQPQFKPKLMRISTHYKYHQTTDTFWQNSRILLISLKGWKPMLVRLPIRAGSGLFYEKCRKCFFFEKKIQKMLVIRSFKTSIFV